MNDDFFSVYCSSFADALLSLFMMVFHAFIFKPTERALEQVPADTFPLSAIFHKENINLVRKLLDYLLKRRLDSTTILYILHTTFFGLF